MSKKEASFLRLGCILHVISISLHISLHYLSPPFLASSISVSLVALPVKSTNKCQFLLSCNDKTNKQNKPLLQTITQIHFLKKRVLIKRFPCLKALILFQSLSELSTNLSPTFRTLQNWVSIYLMVISSTSALHFLTLSFNLTVPQM